MSKIFICVPTQNDKDYLKTIERAYDFASNPDDIFIGTTIFWKEKDISSEFKPFFLDIKNKLDSNFSKVKYDIQPWSKSPGVCRGRLSASKHYNGEKYFLSIDSHTDFTENWDQQMIDLYEGSRKYFGKRRVITSYLSPFFDAPDNGYDETLFTHETIEGNPVNNRKDTLYRKDENIGNRWPFFDFHKKIGVYGDDKVTDRLPLPNDKPLVDHAMVDHLFKSIIDNKYLPAQKISAHFYFTESDPWVTKYNMNLNENILWWGEEFSQSLISYARGYNFVWVKPQIIFHKYGTYDKEYTSMNDIKTDKEITPFRQYPDELLEKFESDEDRYSFYKEYIYTMFSSKDLWHDLIPENDDFTILMNILNNYNFGYLPRSINGFIKHSKVDFNRMKCRQWWEVPDINVVYK